PPPSSPPSPYTTLFRSYTCTHGPYNEPGPGFLGPSTAPFRPMGPSRNDMLLRGISVDRLADRKALLRSFDGLRRELDAGSTMEGDRKSTRLNSSHVSIS